eukprot:8312380-Alexandrium_andersonii.AAC.1
MKCAAGGRAQPFVIVWGWVPGPHLAGPCCGGRGGRGGRPRSGFRGRPLLRFLRCHVAGGWLGPTRAAQQRLGCLGRCPPLLEPGGRRTRAGALGTGAQTRFHLTTTSARAAGLTLVRNFRRFPMHRRAGCLERAGQLWTMLEGNGRQLPK